MSRLTSTRIAAPRTAIGVAIAALVSVPAAAVAESPPLSPVRSVDLLIVVDTSPDAAATAERAAFRAAIPSFVDGLLARFPGDYQTGMLDLQVGVITADPADGGRLRTVSVDACAAAPTGAFAHYLGNAYGQVTQNYTGTLADAIRCLVPSDAQGAAIAQPFATMRSALDGSVPDDAGFLRADAALAVLVVTVQDDCSAIGSPPLTRFACAIDGWSCTSPVNGAPGARDGCVASYAPTGLVSDDDALNSLRSLKPLFQQVAFGALRGPATPVAVVDGSAGLSIAPSCAIGTLVATPALRLDALAASVPNTWLGSACDATGLVGFIDPIVAAATAQPFDDHDGGYFGDDCDGGLIGEPAGGGGDDTIGCACGAGRPSAGTGACFAIAFVIARRRRRRR